MKTKKIRQEDIAKAARVSVSTVSRVLSGTPGISEDTRSHVLKVSSDMGNDNMILPNALVSANAVRLKRALLFLNESDTYQGIGAIYSFIVDGLRQAADDASLPIEFAVIGEDGEIPQQLLGDAQTGVLFAGIDPSAKLIKKLVKNGNPSVLVNGLDLSMQLDHVAPNNLFGGMLAAKHIIENGHQSILHVGTERRWTLRTRSEGFLLGINIYGDERSHCETLMLPNLTEAHARKALETLDEVKPFPYSAIFCSSDSVALIVMQELRLRGLQVPDDVSVLGFNGTPIAELSSPPLSTLRVDWEHVGAEAIRLLLRRAADPQSPTQQSLIQASLVPRGSIFSRANA